MPQVTLTEAELAETTCRAEFSVLKPAATELLVQEASRGDSRMHYKCCLRVRPPGFGELTILD